MSNDAYSTLKATRHLDIIQSVREGRPVRPAHVQIIISDTCNQSCLFCAYRDPQYSSSQMFYEIKPQGAALRRDGEHPERNYNPNRVIPTEKVIEILNDCKAMGVSGVQFTGGGEPTVHPNFLDIVGRAQDHGLATSLVSNGVNIGKRGLPWTRVLAGMSWVRISIDAGSMETYCKIRNVPDWHWNAAWDAVKLLREASDRRGGKLVVGVGFVVTPENWTEVRPFVRDAKLAGAHNVRISAQFSTKGDRLFDGIYADASEICRQVAEGDSDAGFQVYNRFGEKIDDLHQAAPDYQRCGYQEFTTYIGGDLNVYRCCVTSYNKTGLIGSLKDRSFQDLWMSQARADEMKKFDARGCERCQFNQINRVLNYMISDEDQLHEEFV